MNDDAVKTVVDYMNECLFEPDRNWPKNEFKRRSYSRCAANEILKMLLENPLASVNMIIYDFIFKMHYFSYIVADGERRLIFSSAIDVAEDILFLII